MPFSRRQDLVVTALVRNGQSLCPGDNVIVRESRGKALASVFMGYGAPLLVLLSVCAIGLACSVKEDLVACVAIVIVIIYYALLYFLEVLCRAISCPRQLLYRQHGR